MLWPTGPVTTELSHLRGHQIRIRIWLGVVDDVEAVLPTYSQAAGHSRRSGEARGGRCATPWPSGSATYERGSAPGRAAASCKHTALRPVAQHRSEKPLGRVSCQRRLR